MADPKVAREVAEQEFDRMCAARRIECDVSTMNDGDKAGFDAIKSWLVPVIMRGELVIEDDGSPTFTPPGRRAMTFRKVTGATLVTADKTNGGEVAKQVAVMAELTGINPGEFSKLDLADFRVCSDLVRLFLAR